VERRLVIDRVFDKLERVLFGDAVIYFGIFVCVSMSVLIVANIIRWIW